jgi:hypothetical protein
MTERCGHCDDTLWVCGAHPDRPWYGASSQRACRCGAPVIPCELCNPRGGLDEPPDTWRARIAMTPEETPASEKAAARARARRTRQRAIEIIRRDRRSSGK